MSDSPFTRWERAKFWLQRRGISPFRCPHNYDRHWVDIWDAVKWSARNWKSPVWLLKRWLFDWTRCKDCGRLMHSVIEGRSDKHIRCWIISLGLTPNLWVWSPGWFKENFGNFHCWLYGHDEKYEKTEEHMHIRCVHCNHVRWEYGPNCPLAT